MSPCLICGGSSDKNKSLEAQTNVVFLLENILGVPSTKCVEYLERFGNPCEWINLCPLKCHPLISSALETHKQIWELSHKLGVIKEQIVNGIRQNTGKGQSWGPIEEELREIVNSGISDGDETEVAVPSSNFAEIEIKMEAQLGSLEAFVDYEIASDFTTEEQETEKFEDVTKFLDGGNKSSASSDSEFNPEEESADSDYDGGTGKGKIAAKSSDYSGFMEITAEGKFSCGLCPKIFGIRNTLRKHQNSAHNLFFKKHGEVKAKAVRVKREERLPNGELRCTLCTKTYEKRNSLRKHQNYVHNIFYNARKEKLREIVIEPLGEESSRSNKKFRRERQRREDGDEVEENILNNEENVEAVSNCAEMDNEVEVQEEPIGFGAFDSSEIDQEEQRKGKSEDEAEFLDEGGSEWEGDKNSGISGENNNTEEYSDDSDCDEKSRKRKRTAKFPRPPRVRASKRRDDKDKAQEKEEESNFNECLECSQTFPSKMATRNHNLAIHSAFEEASKKPRRMAYLGLVKEIELTPWKCSECFRWFSNEGLRDEHQRAEHEKNLQIAEDLQFSCDECESRRYRSAAELSLHNELEHDGRGLKESDTKVSCESCARTFREASRHEFHLGQVHGILANLKKAKVGGICPICGLGCDSLHYLSTHMRLHRGVRRFLCELCSSTFTANRYLEIHKTRVHGATSQAASHPFGCGQCDRIFSTKFYLKAHMATKHEKKYKYICDICGAGRAQLSAFKQHMLSHQEKREYICAQCGAKYKTSSGLSYHMGAKHSGNKHPCGFCGREFSAKQDRIRHENAVHKKNPKYKCQDCSKTFPIMDYYSRHRKRCHGNK